MSQAKKRGKDRPEILQGFARVSSYLKHGQRFKFAIRQDAFKYFRIQVCQRTTIQELEPRVGKVETSAEF